MMKSRNRFAVVLRRTSSSFALSACAAALLALPTAVSAQSTEAPQADDQSQLADIVVTAQRREENLQSVPVTITALSAEKLERFSIQSTAELSAVAPGVLMNSVAGYILPYIRGIGTTVTGSGAESPVAIYLDGVYMASQSAPMTSLNNIAAIEIDKGPQGTLFGRNATGGAIQIRTLDPSYTFSGKVNASYGNYQTVRAGGYVTGGLTDTIAADLSVGFLHQGKGYGTNLTTGREISKAKEFGIRSKILADVTDTTKFELIGDYSKTTDRPALLPAPGVRLKGNRQAAENPRDGYGVYEPFAETMQWGVSGKLTQELGDITLMSLTSFRKTQFDSVFFLLTDDPGFTFRITNDEPHKQFSQELQLQSSGDGPLQWTVGGIYFWERAGYMNFTTLRGTAAPAGASGGQAGVDTVPDATLNSYAAYAQGTYAITPTTHLTAGIRYTSDAKELLSTNITRNSAGAAIASSTFTSKKTFKKVTWRLAVTQELTDDITAFLSYNRGFKSGGFNTAVDQPFNPEVLDAYEGGLKMTLFDRRLRLNVAGFYYDYANLQVRTFLSGRGITLNGGTARLYGLDADFEAAVSSDLKVNGGIVWMSSKYTDYPLAPITVPDTVNGGTISGIGSATGNTLSRAPNLTFNLGANYTKEVSFGKVTADILWSHNGGFFGDVDNRLRQPAYSVVNGGLGVELESGTGVNLWVKNLTNELYVVQLAARASPGDFAQYAPPRTYGLTVTQKF